MGKSRVEAGAEGKIRGLLWTSCVCHADEAFKRSHRVRGLPSAVRNQETSELKTDLGISSTWIAYCLDTTGKGVTEDGVERSQDLVVVGHYPSTKVEKRSDQQQGLRKKDP